VADAAVVAAVVVLAMRVAKEKDVIATNPY